MTGSVPFGALCIGVKKFWEKYKIWIVITVAFVLIVTVLSKNTLLEAMAINRRIKKMHEEQVMYRERAREDSMFLEKLKSDWFLEKYARETFYMKAPGEEIYLVEE